MTKERFDKIIKFLGSIKMGVNSEVIREISKMINSSNAIVRDSTWEDYRRDCTSFSKPSIAPKSFDPITYSGCADLVIDEKQFILWIYEGDSYSGSRKLARCKFIITGELYEIGSINEFLEDNMSLEAASIYYKKVADKERKAINKIKEQLINLK